MRKSHKARLSKGQKINNPNSVDFWDMVQAVFTIKKQKSLSLSEALIEFANTLQKSQSVFSSQNSVSKSTSKKRKKRPTSSLAIRPQMNKSIALQSQLLTGYEDFPFLDELLK